MIKNLNKSEFKTSIGKFYYLWENKAGGTSFQKRIWEKLASVPYGETVSYKRLSFLSGYERAWRAAGSALSRNPVILVIPCHRVIKSDGRIGRFTGGTKLKEFLVNLEKGADKT